MRNLRKLTTAVLAIALVLTSMTAVFAADSAAIANADNAVMLKDLGLYSGQDANDPKVGLENALTTQDSLIFLAKLFGYNEAANALTADQVSQALAKFDDAASISDYAKNVVAYSAANGILNGMTDGKKFFVGAKDTVTAARFATFMLKQMGYTVADYKQSVAKLAETKGSKVDAALAGDLTRDDAVGFMYGALTAEKASGKTVIADIVGDNADLKKKAEKAGLIAAEPIQSSGSTSSSNDGGSTGNTGDNTPPEIDKDDCRVVQADGKIYLKFSEPMNESQMTAKSNYMVQPKDSAELRVLDEDDTISRITERVVLIDLDEEVDSPDVKIAPIIDLAGNRLFRSVESVTLMDIDAELEPEVELDSAELTASNKLKIVFNTELYTFNYSDVEISAVYSSTTESAIKFSLESQNVNNEGNTEIVFTLDDVMNTDATFTFTDAYENLYTAPVYIITKAATSSTSVFGTKLKPSQKIEVADKAPPEVAKYMFKGDSEKTPQVYIFGFSNDEGTYIDPSDNDDKLEKDSTAYVSITFTEPMDIASMSRLSFTVDGYKVVDVLWDDTNGNAIQDDKEYILFIKAKEDNTPARTSVTLFYNIADKKDNEMASGSTWTIRDIADYVR